MATTTKTVSWKEGEYAAIVKGTKDQCKPEDIPALLDEIETEIHAFSKEIPTQYITQHGTAIQAEKEAKDAVGKKLVEWIEMRKKEVEPSLRPSIGIAIAVVIAARPYKKDDPLEIACKQTVVGMVEAQSTYYGVKVDDVKMDQELCVDAKEVLDTFATTKGLSEDSIDCITMIQRQY